MYRFAERLRAILLPVLLFAPFLLQAQVDNVYVYGTVKDYTTAKKLDAVTVAVYKNGVKLTETVTSANGKYEFNLDYGSDFKIVYSKAGIVSKFINIDTRNIPEEERAGGHGMNVEMTLFNELPGVDFSILQQPIGKAKYDAASGDVTWDLQYTDQIRSELARLMKEYDDKRKREVGAGAEYDKLMAQGETAMSAADYKKAVESFNGALGLKPNDAKATARLSDAKMKLDEIEGGKKADAAYAAAIKEADALFGKKDYEGAKGKYKAALEAKAEEAYPKDRVKECDRLIAELAKKAEEERKAKELEEKYKAAIAAADAAFKGKQWEAAKGKYTEAVGLKEQEKYPKDQLAAVEKAMADEAAQAEKDRLAKELEANYTAVIAAADKAFTSKSWDQAVAKYNEALGLKPAEKHPKDRLAAIEKARADESAQAEKDRLAKELDANYAAAIAAADKAFTTKSWDEAVTKYNEALGLKPTEKHPKDRLAAIEKAKADETAQAEKDRLAKELDANYAAAIAAADKAFASKTWDEAVTKYNEALGLKPAEKHPKDRLAAIEKAKADESAKAEKDRLDKERDEKYAAAIAAGDQAFGAKDWDAAKKGYNDALAVKTGEKYPKDQITAIDAAIRKAASDKDAAELQARYQAIVDEAEGHFRAERYEEAKTKFKDALKVKPDENMPKERLVEIDARLAERTRKADEERKRQELDARYAALITKADGAFGKKDLAVALTDYRSAAELKPEEQHPKDRIAEIQGLLESDAKAKAEADRLAKEKADLDARYADLISKADKAFKAAKYEDARKDYQAAAAVKSEETYPPQRIAEIDRLVAELADKAAADRLKAEQDAAEKARLAEEERLRNASAAELEARYKAAITKADGAFRTGDHATARSSYEEALTVKPKEAYPTDRIAEIDRLLAEMASKADADRLKAERDAAEKARLEEERRQRELADADAARAAAAAEAARLADAQARESQYLSIISEADAAMGRKDYETARGGYTMALDIKPNEAYPRSKIQQIDMLLAEMERQRQEAELAAQKAESERATSNARNVTINTGKEQEAEQFMRNALERETAEKYERIKRMKEGVQEQQTTAEARSLDRRAAVMDRNNPSVTEGAGIYQGSDGMRQRNGEEMLAWKEELARRNQQVSERADGDRAVAQEAVQGLAESADARDRSMRDRHDADVDRFMSDVSAANDARAATATRSEERQAQAREAVIQQNEEMDAMRARGNSNAERNQAQVEADKERYNSIGQQMNNRSLDTRTASKERIDASAVNAPRAFSDYNRSALAAEYPQGVTEESRTEGNKVIIRRVVVQGNKADEYRKVIGKSGTFYFKNGQSITEVVWGRETQE